MENKINLTPNDPIKIKTGGMEPAKSDLATESKTALDLKSIIGSDPLTEKKINEEKGEVKDGKNEKPAFFSTFAKDTAKAGAADLPPFSPTISSGSENKENEKPWKPSATMDSGSSKPQPAIETKNGSRVTLVAVGAIAAVITAILSGGIVYFWQSSEINAAKQNTAQLQSQVGSLKSQVATLTQSLENERAASVLKETPTEAVPTITITPKISTEGWTKFVFNEIDGLYSKPFEFSYPAYGVIKGSAETQSMNLGVPMNEKSKLLTFAADGKDCWLNILEPPVGVDQPVTGLTTEKNIIAIGETTWANSIRKIDGKLSHYGFSQEDTYNFSVSLDNLDQCLETYQTILSTFKFTNEAG